MKKILFLSIFIISTLSLYSQQSVEKKEQKKGWNFGALPTLTYNSDLGFQYGALVNIYHYGDGEAYPKYKHSLYAEASRYTKGSGIYRLFYDSEFLVPNIRISTGLSYLPNQALNFFGFNGYEAVYNQKFTDTKLTEDYKTRMFYNHKRDILSFNADFQGRWLKPQFRWLAGYNIMSVKIGSVPIDKLNKGVEEEKQLPKVNSLYDDYIDWGIISQKEKNGGLFNSVKLGLVYDTRDNEPLPTKGIWSEIILTNTFGKDYHFGRISATHRGYFTLVPDQLSFAYRIGYQGILYGKAPFYALPKMIFSYMSSPVHDGLGGGKNIRGMMLNRTVGKGVVFSNLELRYKFARFKLLGQNLYTALSTFADGGMVVQKVEIDKSKIPSNVKQEDYFSNEKESIHITYGAGLHIGMNENFVVAIDYGRSKQADGGSGMYIGLNWLF